VLKNGENDLSVSCTYEKTDQYYLVLSHYSSSAVDTPEAIHYSVKVDGVSSTSDSAGLSYAIIGISLALLVGLLIIANRKIMP
jgi:hypothetical protein